MSQPQRNSGYNPALRNYSTDPRMMQQRQSAQSPQHRQSNMYQQQQRPSPPGSYNMENMNDRPRPPPHRQSTPHSSSTSRQSTMQQQYSYQQQQQRPIDNRQSLYQSSPQQQRPHPPQHYQQQQQQQQQHQRMSRPGVRPPPNSNSNYYMQHPQQQGGAYRRTTVNRSRSLSRPERQRPRQGMFRTPSQQRRLIGSGLPGPAGATMMHHYQRPRMNPNQPMSNRLQQQLQQQKFQQQQEALLNNNQSSQPIDPRQQKKLKQMEEEQEKPDVLTNWWSWMAFLATCCIPNWFIRVCLRKPNPLTQQAWREKLTLCYIIFLLCAALGFITYGLTATLCPNHETNLAYSAIVNGKRVPMWRRDVRVFGRVYDLTVMREFFKTKGLDLSNDYENMDISSIFNGDTTGTCREFPTSLGDCTLYSPYGGSLKTSDGQCISTNEIKNLPSKGSLAYTWADLRPNGELGDTDLVVLSDKVLNLTRYFNKNNKVYGDKVDTALQKNRGNDASYALLYSGEGNEARRCIVDRYSVGIMEVDAGGCIASQLIMTVMLIVIIALIVIRYSMALLFQWIIASKLVKPGGRSNWLAWRSIKGGNDDPANHVPGPYNNYGHIGTESRGSSTTLGSGLSSRGTTPQSEHNSAVELGGNGVQSDIVSTELYTVLLVTCYSEGEEGLRTTMDSLAMTTYSKKHKIFFVIADGLITGAGETRSTPDIVVDMMDLDPTMRDPKPSSYLAIADGEKQLNMAKVYAGHYKGVPCITIVKCGTEEEKNAPKAGNRGKRDSQLILMSFFQRVLFNDRLSELDYEIFWKMSWLMKGVTPDKFELVLMVDADTQVLPDALTYMVAAMANDITIMGLCGETRIANKRTSWVTAIQVFEYYISHHYAKAFESLFGIVTCLPGCFSMYRIKSPKNGAWVPILANPDIILEYNQNVVVTLHEKNLLLLGEDRFLSTLMLRTFPKRQMMFVPQARCRTVVPDEFKVLLSQRRRWINSTIHNLMELVLVSDLCGIACLSMQFSVFIDLIGTLVLPAAICMTIYLIVNTAISSNPQWQSLALLIAILGLPAVLIAITTFKFVYVMWMIIYLIALPIWNFVLPLYSFWHFDDFSWGATRVIAGEKKDKGHGDNDVMKKWEDWEAERTGQRFNKNKLALKTPLDPPSAFDGLNQPGVRKSGLITPNTPFGMMFNDRKMYNSSPSLNTTTNNNNSSTPSTPH
ncbi:chitin synthase-domain-containing protein [Cunninghamella echinulata]|nr:chitin synthase-domain-containing protein [Cunninghamella echinulata]